MKTLDFTAYVLVEAFVLVCTVCLAARVVYVKLAERQKPKQDVDDSAVDVTPSAADEERESACQDVIAKAHAAGDLSQKDAEAKLPYVVVVTRHGSTPVELHQISRTCQYNNDAMKAYNSVLGVIEKLHLQLVREHTWIKTPRSDPAEFQVTWFPPM